MSRIIISVVSLVAISPMARGEVIVYSHRVPHLSDSEPYKVILEQTIPHTLSRVYIEAIPQVQNCGDRDDTVETRKSNILDVALPHTIQYIERPPKSERSHPADRYLEYITVAENSAFTTSRFSDSSLSMSSEEVQDYDDEEVSSLTSTSNDSDALTENMPSPPVDPSKEATLVPSKQTGIQQEQQQDTEPPVDIPQDSKTIPSQNKNNQAQVMDVLHKQMDSLQLQVHSLQKQMNSSSQIDGEQIVIVPTKATVSVALSPCEAVESSSPTDESSQEELTDSKLIDQPDIQPTIMEEEVSSNFLSIRIEDQHKGSPLVLRWEESTPLPPGYQVQFYAVNVVGTSFQPNVNSNMSYECNINKDNMTIRGIHHCWNVTKDPVCNIIGVIPGHTYSIFVEGTYSCPKGEVSIKSAVELYTLKGPPGPPKLTSFKAGLYQVSFSIDPPEQFHPDVELQGYKVFYDSVTTGDLIEIPAGRIEKTLLPGATVSITAVTVPKQNIGESKQSQPIQVTCPLQPLAPAIGEQTSFKKGCIVIGWCKPPTSTEQIISMYKVYTGDKLSEEVQSSKHSDKNGYQFMLTELSIHEKYKVYVKSVCGQKHVEPGTNHVYVMSDSLQSNTLTVSPPAGPGSPKLYLESMTPQGIDVVWETPQQHGDIVVTALHIILTGTFNVDTIPIYELTAINVSHVRASLGYQMYKNNQIYGSVIPPEINALRIRDVSLGDHIVLQLISLTKRPTSKTLNKQNTDEDHSGSMEYVATGPALTDSCSGCDPGPLLDVHFTGLVQPPVKVWCEKVTGHSALIVWNKDQELKAHHVHPDRFQLTWWPGERAEEDIGSDCTNEDHFVLPNLRPNTSYTVVVEARMLKKVNEENKGFVYLQREWGKPHVINIIIKENLISVNHESLTDLRLSVQFTPESYNSYQDEDATRTFVLSSKSEKISLKTASPPEPPSSIGVISTTCHSVKLAWNPPREHGVEITSLYLELMPMADNTESYKAEEQRFLHMRPDSKEAVFENLAEKTEYLVRIFAVSDEYFDLLPRNHRLKKLRYIPEGVCMSPAESIWLPYSNLVFRTSGTDPATNLKISQCASTSLTVTWINAIVYGTNQIQGSVVRWTKVQEGHTEINKELLVGQHTDLSPKANWLTIKDLVPGCQYCITVDTIVNLKTSLESGTGSNNNLRTAHVTSKPLMAVTRASIQPPTVYVSSYKGSTIKLYWVTPNLTSVVGKDINSKPLYLKCYLLGYQLIVNDLLHATLRPEDKHCTLQKCKLGKNYSVVLVAMSCSQKADKVKKWKRHTKMSPTGYWQPPTPPNAGIDYTRSEPLDVKLPLKTNASITAVNAMFRECEEKEEDLFGELFVEWSVCKKETIGQFAVSWFTHGENVVVTKYIPADTFNCSISVNRLRSVYEIKVESDPLKEVTESSGQAIHVGSPGEPDPPQLLLKSVSSSEICVVWQEPRIYSGSMVKAYQLYVDNKPAFDVDCDKTSCVYSCLSDSIYKLNLVALGSNPKYGNSMKSNTLIVTTPSNTDTTCSKLDLMLPPDQQSKSVPNSLTAVKVTDTSIHLEWSSYIAPEGIKSYKIQWTSVAQPEPKDVTLTPKDQHCTINKCLPGVIHYLQLVAIGNESCVLDQSRYLTVQTSAPPDIPILSVRACNFQYISVQWNKPLEYGEARICGYRIYVNDEVKATLPGDQTTYTFADGEWCTDYSFQIQALTTFDWLSSKPSETLTITWPGVIAPVLHRDPPSGPILTVTWDFPCITDGVKIKHFKVTCLDDMSDEVVQIVEPISTESQTAQFNGLKYGDYTVVLTIYTYGTKEVISSQPIRVKLIATIVPPTIKVNAIGLEERRKLENATSRLLNARDKLIRKYNNKQTLLKKLNAKKIQEMSVIKTSVKLEAVLHQYLSAISQYTGQIQLDITWDCKQCEPEVEVTGYQLLLNGQHYGGLINKFCTNLRTTLKADGAIHNLSMVAVCGDLQMSSEESNVVQLPTTSFLPFMYYCYCTAHINRAKWPSSGCCQFVDSFQQEHRLFKKLSNPGLFPRQFQSPDCSLWNLFSQQFESLLPTVRPSVPMLVLFWTPWCHPSQRAMDMFGRFAQEHSQLFSYLCVSCDGHYQADESHLHKYLVEKGWKEESGIRHCSSRCTIRTTSLMPDFNQENENLDLEDFRKYLGIEGVPSYLIIDEDGFVVWHGRFCAPTYKLLSSFIYHTLHQISSVNNEDCIHCETENSVGDDTDFINELLQESGSLLEKLVPASRPASAAKPKKMLSKRQNSKQHQISFDKESDQQDQLLDLNIVSSNEQLDTSKLKKALKKRHREPVKKSKELTVA